MRSFPRRPPRFLPRLEVLETRCAPACHLSEKLGVLSVVGDNARNVIQITDNGGTAAGSVTVTCGNTTLVSTNTIHDIRVQGGGGNDRVTYNLTGDLAPRLYRGLHIDLGMGNDTFQANLAGGVEARGFLDLNVDGGPGNDSLRLKTPTPGAVAAGAILRLDFVAGDDADHVAVGYQGQVVGKLLFLAEGNPGPDRMAADFTLLSGSTGYSGTTLRGGSNIDNLSLLVHKENPADPVTVYALADGGQSIDFCRHTRNVISSRCEIDTVV
jgi:hypothetical protein